MYKVSYYIDGNESVIYFQWFKTLHESTEFANKQKTGNVREIKFYDANNLDNPKP
jgi:hypothetical protein